MKKIHFQIIGLFLTILFVKSVCEGQAISNSLYPVSVQREVDLMQSLFLVTNNVFDHGICRSISIQQTGSFIVSYAQVSFIFYYPEKKDVALSASEMGAVDGLKYRKGTVTRTNMNANEIPINYVRVWDPSKTNVTAELEVLLIVSADGNPRDQQCLRRFRYFDYTNTWKPKE
jgi:hypothetical protein